MKVLILILSSPGINDIYTLHKDIWEQYMNSNPDIDCYFMEYKSDEVPENESIVVKGNTIYIRGVESLHPGCFNKTIDCFDFFRKNKDNNKVDTNNKPLKSLYDYDYIIRTNLSSLWNFNALIKHLETLPKNGTYSGFRGYHDNITFASGAGMVMTPDIVELVITHRKIAESYDYMDDVIIALILSKFNISSIPAKRTDLYSMNMFNNFKFNNNDYHYRIKWTDLSMRHEEYYVMMKILDMINSSYIE